MENKTMKRWGIAILLVVLLASVFLAACGEKKPVDQTKVTGVEFDRETLSIEFGSTYQLVYSVLPDTALNKRVSFSSSDRSIVTVTSTGLITAVKVGTGQHNHQDQRGRKDRRDRRDGNRTRHTRGKQVYC